MSVELFKVKQYSKTSKGFEFLKLTAKHKVLQNLKRSWKKSLKVVEFEELKRVRTLGHYVIIFYLQAAIANARSLDEVQRLEMLLKTGQVPGRSKQNDNVDEEMEDISNGT